MARALVEGGAIGAGMNMTRELGNLPANICTPSYLASQARALARGNAALGCKVLDEKKMKELGMGALLSVTAGTREPAVRISRSYVSAAAELAAAAAAAAADCSGRYPAAGQVRL